MALMHRKSKPHAAFAAVFGRYFRRVVTPGKDYLGVTAAVVGILQVGDGVGQRGQRIHMGVGQPDLDPGQVIGLVAGNDLPVDVVGDICRAVLTQIHRHDVIPDIVHIPGFGVGGQRVVCGVYGQRRRQAEQQGGQQHGQPAAQTDLYHEQPSCRGVAPS